MDLAKEHKKIVSAHNNIYKLAEKKATKIINDFELKVTTALIKTRPLKKVKISGVKTKFGDKIIAISHNEIFIGFKDSILKVSKLSYTIDIDDKTRYLDIIPIQEKIKLIKKLKKASIK